MPRHYDWYSIEPARHGDGVSVYGWDTYPDHSVLAGQNRKSFLDSFKTEEAAREAYPQAEEAVSRRDAGNTFGHLPGEDDPVPGGMYPDDFMGSVTQHENSGDWY